MAAQTKLATLYKSHSEEHTGKVEELSCAVKELQELLKESSEKYGKLETELAAARDKNKEEVDVWYSTWNKYEENKWAILQYRQH